MRAKSSLVIAASLLLAACGASFDNGLSAMGASMAGYPYGANSGVAPSLEPSVVLRPAIQTYQPQPYVPPPAPYITPLVYH